MASNPANVEVATREWAMQLIPYLDILYPGGKAINPIRGQDPSGYPMYPDEVSRFVAAMGQNNFIKQGSLEIGNNIYSDKEKIRHATWEDLGQMFLFCVRSERHGSTAVQAAVSDGTFKIGTSPNERALGDALSFLYIASILLC